MLPGLTFTGEDIERLPMPGGFETFRVRLPSFGAEPDPLARTVTENEPVSALDAAVKTTDPVFPVPGCE